MVKRKNVAVIGGGVSGLAPAKAFDERGHRVGCQYTVSDRWRSQSFLSIGGFEMRCIGHSGNTI